MAVRGMFSRKISEDGWGMDEIWELTVIPRKWLLYWSSTSLMVVCHIFGWNF